MTIGLNENKVQGQIRLIKWPFISRRVLVSSGVTAESIGSYLDKNDPMSERGKEFVANLESFSRIRHITNLGSVKIEILDASLSETIRFTRIMRFFNFWPVKSVVSVINMIKGMVPAWKQ